MIGIIRPAYTLMTGFIGTAWISIALSNANANREAYRLLQQTAYPSWLYPVVHGATTIWERLDGYTVEKGFGGHNGMNSFNHYSFGAVGQWLIAYSLGIQGTGSIRALSTFPETNPILTGRWFRRAIMIPPTAGLKQLAVYR